ncbi:phosphate signaling complex PhoU family protein [Mycobacterium intracellulare]|uniref:phosphate signaling complex PhoU family protein n=1 Tax=Mycobacterium intracellulare TaxID=1767 RepID=UPI0031F0BA1C
MRSAYHDQLAALTALMGEMCRRADVAMDGATQALLQSDLVVAERVITDHDQTASMNTAAQDRAFVLLALQAPVAWRVARSCLGIADRGERRADGRTGIACRQDRAEPPSRAALPEDVSGYFAQMGHLAVGLSNSAEQVLLSGDPEHAARIDEEDDAMDDLHRHLFTVLMDGQCSHGVAAAVDVTLLGRFYERFADHAVAIAHRVIFQASGARPDDEPRALR